MANRISLNGTSYHGAGAIGEIVNEVNQRGFKKAFVASDPDLIKFGVTAKVTDLLDEAGIPYSVYSDIKPNPTIENVKNGVAAFKESEADCIIAIGGGSSMDTSKAIGIIITNPEFEDVRSLEGVAPTKNPCVPIIAVPTTAGTAAEVTINYVITDVEKQRKFVCVDTHDMPIVAVVDPEMMSTMPKGLTAATGMDALTHAIEGYITKGAWEMTDMFHLEAIKLISQNLRAAPHGMACAQLLPISMEFNRDYTGEKYREIARAMGVDGVDAMSQEEYRDAAIAAVRQLSEDVAIPAKNDRIVEAELEQLAEDALNDACYPGNPREATKEQVIEMFRQLM